MVSEAHLIQLAHLFDPMLAVPTSLVKPHKLGKLLSSLTRHFLNLFLAIALVKKQIL
ncbi:hypothetical protein [Myxosarcina sp. GI1]|uniref:hypothetical protein n=1 Tax=Myxosarcina sp. GI1 TaxID=1541065 RepID=UPI001C1270D4|nr:hypothetical protein [Myxosarcina sp. GI1]